MFFLFALIELGTCKNIKLFSSAISFKVFVHLASSLQFKKIVNLLFNSFLILEMMIFVNSIDSE